VIRGLALSSWPKVAAIVVTATLFAFSWSPVLAQTERDVDRAEGERDAAYQRLVTTQYQLEEALIAYDQIHTALDDLEYRISRIEKRIAEYGSQATDLEEVAQAVVVDAYMNGGLELVTTAFGAGSLQDLVTAQFLTSRAADRNGADISRLTAVGREMGRLTDDLEKDRLELDDLTQEANAVVQQVDEALNAARHELEHADQRYADVKARFEEEQRKRREAELAAIRSRSSESARGLPSSATSGFLCPVQGGASFIDSWGFARSGGRRHKGVDMFAPRGTATIAVTSGSIKLRTVNLGGIVAYLYGDDGNKYYYAHLNGHPEGLRDGQRVERGAAIGYVGNTGNAEGTSPHLHFEIRPGGAGAVNPYPTVREACP
jgi:murein DD-endopeptidase MepM/ murein hydrolase activator NlpD